MNIPHFFQSSEQNCGAACLRMILAALGHSKKQSIIARQCGITLLGCTVHDLEKGAQALGFNVGNAADFRRSPSGSGSIESNSVCSYDRSSGVVWRTHVSMALRSAAVSYRRPVNFS